MLIHTDPFSQIYFGNAQDKLFDNKELAFVWPPKAAQAVIKFAKLAGDQDASHMRPEIEDKINGLNTNNMGEELLLVDCEPFNKIKKLLHLESISFLRQTHSTDGLVITSPEYAQTDGPFVHEGDYLITNVLHAGIGVLTADCLPIIVFDKLNNVVGIAHAGWRGTVAGVAVTMINRMLEEFGTDVEHVRVYFGPSAKACCYQVSPDFHQNLESFAFMDSLLHTLGDKIHFDAPLCNQLQLEQIGIARQDIHVSYNICTMCDDAFYSHRRDGAKAGRNITVVALK